MSDLERFNLWMPVHEDLVDDEAVMAVLMEEASGDTWSDAIIRAGGTVVGPPDQVKFLQRHDPKLDANGDPEVDEDGNPILLPVKYGIFATGWAVRR